MKVVTDSRILARRIFQATLFALIGIGGAALGGTEAASYSSGEATRESYLKSALPQGDDCWTEISTQNVLTGGNYLLGMDGDRETGVILAAGYYTYDLGLRSEGAEGGIGGQTQLVLTKTDDAFQIVPNPPDLGDFSRLNGVGAIPETNNEFWLVGTVISTTVTTTLSLNLIEYYDGSTLSIISSPQPAGVGQRLNDVDAASPDFAIAVGSVQSLGGQLLPVIIGWDGDDWVSETPPNVGNAALNGVKVFPDGRAVAVGIDYDPNVRHFVITRDTGGGWDEVSLFLPGGLSQLKDVDASNPTNVVAVGTYQNGQTLEMNPYAVTGNLNTGTFNNTTIPAQTGADTYASAVSCPPDEPCVAVGERDTGTNLQPSSWKQEEPVPTSAFAEQPPDNLYGYFSYFAKVFGFITTDRAAGGVTGMFGALNYSQLGGLNRATVLLYQDQCGPQPSPTPGGSTPVPTATPGPPTATPTPCTPGQFSDVPPEHTFYQFITCLVNEGVISGYSDCTFRPGNNITRGQLSKVVSNAAGFSDPVSGQTFEDILPGSTFYDFVERLASRSIIGGYACGGPGEPCGVGNRPYFRPNANSTRGQISKIVAVAKGYEDPTTNQTFEDVGVGSTFHLWVENLASRGIMSGYACGGPGEPCGVGNRPYFRPSNNASRGQTSKIVANTFFPGCTP